jgi:predicted permease
MDFGALFNDWSFPGVFMDINVVVGQVILLFMIIIVGFYARKRKIITADAADKLSTLLLQITMPMLILSSFQFELSKELLRNAVLVLVISFSVHFFSMLAGKLLYRRFPKQIRNVLKFVTVFPNCAFMGFPILESIFGSKGIFYGTFYIIPFNILSLSYGVMVFTGKSDKDTLKKIVTHPVIVSVAAGILLLLFQLKIPGPVFKAITMLGSMTTPLSMLIVGSLLASIPARELLRGKAIYIGSAIRLIGLPILVLGALSLLPLPKEVAQICVILTAMPAAATTAIFAEKFGGDAMLAARLVSATTILSILTIPLTLLWV